MDITWQAIGFAFVIGQRRRGVAAYGNIVTEYGYSEANTGCILNPWGAYNVGIISRTNNGN